MKRHPRIDEDFQRLAQRVRQIVDGREVTFVINAGNWGDSLIREGSERFLRDSGIAYTPVRLADFIRKPAFAKEFRAQNTGKDRVMIFNGCGAFSSHYSRLDHLRDLSEIFKTSIVLPSTYAIEIPLHSFPNEIVLFARDIYQSAQFMPDAEFCHDMALYLELDGPAPTRRHGHFMRTDRERPAGLRYPWSNVDISRKGRAHTPVDRLVKRLAKYERISTNRLHVGICGALLGRQVRLYGNDYFKIQAIYRSSLEPYYDNIRFLDQYDPRDP